MYGVVERTYYFLNHKPILLNERFVDPRPLTYDLWQTIDKLNNWYIMIQTQTNQSYKIFFVENYWENIRSILRQISSAQQWPPMLISKTYERILQLW